MIKKGDKVTFDNAGSTVSGIVDKMYDDLGIAIVNVDEVRFKVHISELSLEVEGDVIASEPGAKRITKQELKSVLTRRFGPQSFTDEIRTKYDVSNYAFMCVVAASLGNDIIDRYFENGDTIEITAFNFVDQISEICRPTHVREYLPREFGVSECALIGLSTAEMFLQIVPDLFPEEFICTPNEARSTLGVDENV